MLLLRLLLLLLLRPPLRDEAASLADALGQDARPGRRLDVAQNEVQLLRLVGVVFHLQQLQRHAGE